MEPDSFIGRTIGSYRIEGKLGEGGMGAVYRAVHRKLDREAALKILPRHLVDSNPQFVARFFVEARAAAKATHPNIVQVYDAEEADGVCYIAMEFVRGRDLKALLAEKGRLSGLEAVGLVMQAARGLGAASERGFIHRDVKPANLMLAQDGVLKIADFGLAKNVGEATDLTRPGQVMGTPSYMSPEQANGEKADFRTDIYSLGVCLFEMVTGARPFTSETPIGLIKKHCLDPVPDPLEKSPDLHPAFGPLIRKMMAKSRDERFGSYGELLGSLETLSQALRAGAADEGSGADGEPTGITALAEARERKPGHGRFRIVAAGACAILLAAGLLGILAAAGFFRQAPVEKKVPQSSAVEFRLAESEPGPGLEEKEHDGGKLYLHKEVLISGADLDSVAYSEEYEMPVLQIKFKDSSVPKIKAVTSASQGKMLAMLVDGKVIMAPILRTVISDSAQVSGNFTREEILALMARIAGERESEGDRGK